MSVSYFSEKFKEATGINFVDFVGRIQIGKARNLLENPSLRISEIDTRPGSDVAAHSTAPSGESRRTAERLPSCIGRRVAQQPLLMLTCSVVRVLAEAVKRGRH